MRIGLGAGTLALLAQILVWAWAPAAVASADGVSFGGILVCTPSGFKTVVLNGQGEADGDAPAPALGQDGCPLCPLIGGLAPPPDLFALTLVFLPFDREPGAEHHSDSTWFLYNLQARAPPALV
jgi:hypothetical protein